MCSYLTWGSIAVHYAEVAQQLKAHSKIEDFVNKCTLYVLLVFMVTKSTKQLIVYKTLTDASLFM